MWFYIQIREHEMNINETNKKTFKKVKVTRRGFCKSGKKKSQ